MEIETFKDEDTLEERLKKLERANKGLLTDLQTERTERQKYQSEVEQIKLSLQEPEVEPSVQERVNRLAADPDGYISEVLEDAFEKRLKPIEESVFSLANDKKIERAKRWIAKKEGIDPDEVEEKYGADLIRIGNERGLTKIDPEQGIKSAWEILQQEKKDKEMREAERERAIAGQSTETVRPAARSAGAQRFTRDQIARMSPSEFNANYEAIKQAEKDGLIK